MQIHQSLQFLGVGLRFRDNLDNSPVRSSFWRHTIPKVPEPRTLSLPHTVGVSCIPGGGFLLDGWWVAVFSAKIASSLYRVSSGGALNATAEDSLRYGRLKGGSSVGTRQLSSPRGAAKTGHRVITEPHSTFRRSVKFRHRYLMVVRG